MAVRDAAATQRRIAAAALKEFAAKGIAGARVDAIATRARTNKRMIYYYFRSKEDLFREILRQRLARRPGSPIDDLPHGEQLAMRQAIALEHRDYTRLLMWEALETRSRTQKVMAEEERRELYDELRARVVAAQAAGELPAEMDPGQIVLTELALTIFPSAFPQMVRLVTGRSVDDPEFLTERQEHLRQLTELLRDRTSV